MKFYEGQLINYNCHQCKVTETWCDEDGNEGITIKPTGNYGFPIDLYCEGLKRYWAGIESKADYMARYGVDTYAYSEEKARNAFEREYGDSFNIDHVLEM